MDGITVENAGAILDDWLDTYGRDFSFEAKQALIPLRDFLFLQDPQNAEWL